MSKRKRSGRESMRSVQWVSMEKSMVKRLGEEGCFKSRVKKRRSYWYGKSGDDIVDPTCVGWWEGERPECGWGSRKEWGSLFQRWGAACWKERFAILRDEEVRGLDMYVVTGSDVRLDFWCELLLRNKSVACNRVKRRCNKLSKLVSSDINIWGHFNYWPAQL